MLYIIFWCTCWGSHTFKLKLHSLISLLCVCDVNRYLNETMNDGILSAFTALSVHPYRGDAPESVLDDYAQLRAMMADHGVTDMPVLSGEWGYALH